MPLNIYVLSCGVAQEHDYCWCKIRENSQPKEIPPILINRLRATDYIDSQKPSIILAYSDREYLLLVTALDTSPERTDFMGRRIRNSIAWVAQGPISVEEDKLLRGLAIKALNRELDNPVHKAVKNDPQNIQTGFSAQFSKLLDIQESCRNLLEDESTTDSLIFEFAYDNNDNRRDVINDLKSRSLRSIIEAGGTDILLLVTTIKSPQWFEKMQVWRGLSSRVPEEMGWVKKKAISSRRLIDRTTLVIIFLLIVILMIVILLYKINQEKQNFPSNQESQMQHPTTLENQNLEIQIPVLLDSKTS